MMNRNVTWQALDSGEIWNSNLGLPNECQTLNLLVDGEIRLSIDCKGKPFFFVRKFFNYSFGIGCQQIDSEYHIGYDGNQKLEYIYTPKTDEVTLCFGDAKI